MGIYIALILYNLHSPHTAVSTVQNLTEQQCAKLKAKIEGKSKWSRVWQVDCIKIDE